MSDINFTNHLLLVRSMDKNNNGVMDELQASESIMAKVDTDRNGKIERQELVSALKNDSVEINQGRISESKGIRIHTFGLETLQNVHITAKNAKTYVWNMPSDLKGSAGYNEVLNSNREYASAIRSMRNSLESIQLSTSSYRDQTSTSINITSKNALSTERALNFQNLIIGLLDNEIYNTPSIYDDPFKKDDPAYDPYQGAINTQKEINNNLRSSYIILNNALSSIKDQTEPDRLPDVKRAIKATDNSISNAFSNINQIKSDPRSASEVREKLYGIAKSEDGKVTGRATPYGSIGAGIGAVAGGAIGYFTTRNVKAGLIGAGVGTVVAGGVGALIGKSIDNKHKDAANGLRTLGDEVARYNPDAAISKLEDASQRTYQETLGAREKNDLDNARVYTNNINSIRVGVAPIEKESARILEAYRK